MLSYSKYKYYTSLSNPQQGPTNTEFKYFTILLNEDKENLTKHLPSKSKASTFPDSDTFRQNGNDGKEDIILKLGKLLKTKIKAHSGEDAELFTAAQVMQENPNTLVSVMFRMAAEDFVKNSKATFKIIECRNITKLMTDWKPTLVDVILALGHQVILVELQEFPHYTDFSYSILRQINYYWKIRLPRSFFYPDDVCTADFSADQKVVVVTPLMPDGDIDLTNRIHDNLKYEILMMLKESCASGLKNHLLKRDLRVGKFSDTENGVNSIRYIHRSLQRRIKKGDIQLGHTSDASHQILLSLAGESLMTAENHLEFCSNPGAKSREETKITGMSEGGDRALDLALDLDPIEALKMEDTSDAAYHETSSGSGDTGPGLNESLSLRQSRNGKFNIAKTAPCSDLLKFIHGDVDSKEKEDLTSEEECEDEEDDVGDEFFDNILKQLKDIELQYTVKDAEKGHF